MAKSKNGALCGLVDKAFIQVAYLLSFIDTGKSISFIDKDEDSVTVNYANDEKLYGISMEFGSNRIRKDIDGLLNVLKRLKSEEDGKLVINFIKNSKEYFVYIFSTNRSTIQTIASIFALKLLSGDEIAKAFGHYFMFNKYDIDKNTLVDYFGKLSENYIENNQFHRLTEMLSKNVLKNSDVYQAVAYKERDFKVTDLFSIEGWEGVLSIYLDFSEVSLNYNFKALKDRAQKVQADMFKVIKSVEDNQIDVFKQDYGIVNAILISNDKRYVSQIESFSGFLFEENYLTGIGVYKNTFFKKRDRMFDIFIHKNNVAPFFQSCKKRVDGIIRRDDGSYILPDFYGKDIAKSFVNYSLGKNVNPHMAIIAKTGSGKSSALLKILKSSCWLDDNYKTEAFEKDLIKIRYMDVDYSGGNFVSKIKDSYPDDCIVYGSDVSDIKFCLLDLDTVDGGDYSLPIESELRDVSSFVNVVLDATDQGSSMDNAEEDRFKEAVKVVFTNPEHRVDKSIGELTGRDGFELLYHELSLQFPDNTKISQLPEKYNFLKKPTLQNVIDYVSRQAVSNNVSEIQRDVYKTLLKKISGLTIFNFAEFSNKDISLDKKLYYADMGEVKSNQKEFVSLGWMLLRRWFKIDRANYNERVKRGLPRQKIFYVLEESHNFFTIPSFKALFQAAVKELRKFGVHFIFISHGIHDMPEDIYKSIATKIFLFTRGDADAVQLEINEKATMAGERLEVFNAAKEDSYCLFIMHDDGETICKLDMTKTDLETFVPKRVVSS